MLRCIVFLFVAGLLMFTTDTSWCQAEPQHPDNNTEVTPEKNDSRVGTRSESSLHQASPHSQKVIQKKSSASTRAHSHQTQVESIKQDPNIDEILDRHAVQLIDDGKLIHEANI